MNFNFLRSASVNLLRYLPKEMAKDIVFKNTLDICSNQHEKMRLKLMDIARQFFVSTATWGIDDWERVLAIPTVWSESYEVRRNRILLKLQGCQTSSLPFMNALLNRYITDSTGSILEHNETYTFEIMVDMDKVHDWKAMIEAVEIYKPAHLAMYLAMQIFHEWEIHYRASIQQTVDARHCFWNLGNVERALWNGEFPADGSIRGTGIRPDSKYQERQYHTVAMQIYNDAKQKHRWYNIADGSVVADGSHFANGSKMRELVEHAVTFAVVKNNIESGAIPI